MRVAILVPVSPKESIETLRRSVKRLKRLRFDGELKILYVFDGSENDERVLELKSRGVDVLARNTGRGKRAGAINDGVAHLKEFKPDFVAIFDVDSEPDEDFILKCVSEFEDDVYIVSTRRYISNDSTLISKAVAVEYRIINFLLRISAFKQFNGLIGVVRADVLSKYSLDEEAITEDADFSTRMHVLGYRAKLVKGRLYEQAPLDALDFYRQRVRWYYGGLQLWKHFGKVVSSKNAIFKISWLSALTITFFPILFFPLILLSLPALLVYEGLDGLKAFSGLIAHAIILQAASFSAIAKFLRGKKVEWIPPKRV